MRSKIYQIIVVLIFFTSCKNKPASFDTEELIGVWSGLLFQTETKHDSIVLKPVKSPQIAFLYKNGKSDTFKLEQKDNTVSFKGISGVRFDAAFSNNAQSLYGVITENLWSQSLLFLKSENNWVAKIIKPEIIDTDYTVYLEFYRDSLGNLQAKIQSNKENRKLHFSIKKVSVTGNNIDFKITADRFALSATYQSETKKLSIKYGNTNSKRKRELTKHGKNEWKGYTPRPVNKKYDYKIPQPLDALIQTASLKEVGLDPSLLGFMDSINNGAYEHIHSIIITKNKKLVFEEYFHGYNRDYLHDIKSSFKALSSLLLGKAMMKDKSIHINNSIINYYPEYNISDKEKKKITIHHALTMTTGLQLEDEDKMQWENNDWVGYKLNLPMEYEPGEKFEYSSGGINLLTGVLQQSTKKYLPLFFYEEMLRPMRIHKFQMRVSPKGRPYLAGDFYLRPIDFTKFGLLMLNDGVWGNQRIIASEWINTATQAYTIKGRSNKDLNRGYLWKLGERNVSGKQMKTIEAWGNGGQFLIIIPEIEMTITFTGGNYNLAEMETPFEILNKYILPAVALESN
ncbi:MAG: serine hydrolase [Flavobacteriaceae bacterium]|nr:serine hydrolase [Flavobacteriaceae bacterium]